MTDHEHSPVIHILWLQGLDAAPPVVRYNVDRWRRLNPEYEINLLDQADVTQLLADEGLAIKGLAPQALSDIVRVKLLAERGGVWADASLLPIKALDAWLPQRTASSGFFALSRPWPHVIIASWFLAAAPRNAVVCRWWEAVRRYWQGPRDFVPGQPTSPAASVDPTNPEWVGRYPYNWVQYLLEHHVNRDGAVAEALDGAAHLDGVLGRNLRVTLLEGGRDAATLRRAAASLPVQKLDWRVDWPLDVLDAALAE